MAGSDSFQPLHIDALARSVLPRINVSLLQGRVVEQQHAIPEATADAPVEVANEDDSPAQQTPDVDAAAAAAAVSNAFPNSAAAAGQLQQHRRASPPPFRAGFAYERTHTPLAAARQKEQHRREVHRRFQLAQHMQKQPKPAAVHIADTMPAASPAQAMPPAAAAADGVTSKPGDHQQQQQMQQVPALQPKLGGSKPAAAIPSIAATSSINTGSTTASVGPAAAQAAQGSLSTAAVVAGAAHKLLQQQQQQQPGAAGSSLSAQGCASGASCFPVFDKCAAEASSSLPQLLMGKSQGCCSSGSENNDGSSNTAAKPVIRRLSRLSGSFCSNSSICSSSFCSNDPVVGGHNLLRAFAAGCSKQQLQSLASESLAMLAAAPVASRSMKPPAAGKQSRPSSRSRAVARPGALLGPLSRRPPHSRPGSRNNRSSRGRLAAGSRGTAAVSRQNSNSADHDCCGSGSSSSGRNWMRGQQGGCQRLRTAAEVTDFLQSGAQGEEDDEALPSLDSPRAPHEQSSLPSVAAALGQSIQQLRQRQAQQLLEEQQQQQQLHHHHHQQQAAASVAQRTSNTAGQNPGRQRVFGTASPSQPAGLQRAAASADVAGAADVAAGVDDAAGLAALQQQARQLGMQLRTLSVSPGVVQQYSQSTAMLGQAFSHQLQQPAAAPSRDAVAAASRCQQLGSRHALQHAYVAAASASCKGGSFAVSGSGSSHGGVSLAGIGSLSLTSAYASSVAALLAGRGSPVRDKLLSASLDMQQQWQQKKQQLMGWRSTALSASPPGSGLISGQHVGMNQLLLQDDRPFCITPEPYLHTTVAPPWAAESRNGNSSGDSGSKAVRPPSIALPSAAAWKGQQPVAEFASGAAAAGAAAAPQAWEGSLSGGMSQPPCRLPVLGLSRVSEEQQLIQQMCMTAAQGLHGHKTVAAAATASAYNAAASALRMSDMERMVCRYHQQSLGADPHLYPAVFNLNNALSSRQQARSLAAALPHMAQLTTLLLRNNSIDDSVLQLLVTALLQPCCCNVSCLDLAYNKLTAAAPLLLLPLLHQRPQAQLQAMRRSSAGCIDLECGPPGLERSSAGLLRTSSTGARGSSCGGQSLQLTSGFNHAVLLQLVLANNAIGDAGAEVVCKLVATGDCMLQLLDLSGCGISERLSACLKGMLEGARQLQVLRLGWNRLGPKGGKALADGLKYCSSGLTQLCLPWSGITDIGASHIAKALENNGTVKLLDMSGCQVSAGTCVVLAETLSVNRELEALILQDNPLGAAGVKKLLCAVHEGYMHHVDLAGSSFLTASSIKGPQQSSGSTRALAAGSARASATTSAAALSPSAPDNDADDLDDDMPGTGDDDGSRSGGSGRPSDSSSAAQPAVTPAAVVVLKQAGGSVGSAAAAFNEREPDGQYTLDLALPADRQVSIELLRLSKEHGIKSWVEPRLNKKAYSITGVTKESLPTQGLLSVTFRSKRSINFETKPLTDPEFESLWSCQVDPERLTHTAQLLEQPHAIASGSFRRGSNPGLEDGGRFTLQSGQDIDQPLGCSQAPRLAGTALQLHGEAGDGCGSGGGNSSGSAPGRHVRAVSDGWKMQLLQVLIESCYFTSSQAGQIVAGFNYGEDKVEAAVKVFGKVVDPENFATQAYVTMNSWQVELADSRIGCLRLFSPDNPTGKYSLLLSHPAQRLVAVRLVELFRQQHIGGFCSYPHSICFTMASLDDRAFAPQQLQDPRQISLPKSGIFKLCFVDLAPVPRDACPVSPEGFAVLLSVLVSASKLDGRALAEAVDAVDLKTKVTVVGRFDTWSVSHGPFTGKVGVLKRLRPEVASGVTVKDMTGFVEATHLFAIRHYLTGAQLLELLKLLPASATLQRVELCSRFWARLTDRPKTWSDIMRSLTAEQQVAVSHRLGMANVFDPGKPTMHYRLRMWRADEHQIAWRLHRMALTASHEAFAAFAIDGEPKKIVQSVNLWSLMRGSAADNESPTVTLDIDFVWKDNISCHWAAAVIQAAWRAYMSRQKSHSFRSLSGIRAASPGLADSRTMAQKEQPRVPPQRVLLKANQAAGSGKSFALRSTVSVNRRLPPGLDGSLSSPGQPKGTVMKGQRGSLPQWDTLMKSPPPSAGSGVNPRSAQQ